MFRECKPTIFSVKLRQMKPYTNLDPTYVQKVLHLREDIFVVQYMGGLIELRDLSQTADPILSF